MRSVLHFTNYTAKIRVLFLAIAITSCNALRRVDDDELLITKNTISADSIRIADESIQTLVIQKPNTTLLGYPLRLNLYNLAKVNPDSSFNDWLYRKEKRKRRLDNFFSEKQVNRLGESFLVKGLSEWLKEIGEPPAVLDTTLTQKSLERLSAYYSSKGYFNNSTTFTIDSLKGKQRIGVNYNIDLGKPFMLDTVYKDIASKAIDSLYKLNKAESFVKQGQQFDIDDFNKERERLTAVFRNNGVWNFQESAISYDVVTDTTRLADDQEMNIKLNIDDLKKRNENSVTTQEYKVASFDKINIYTDFLNEGDDYMQFERYGDYTVFYKAKLRYRPSTLSDAIFFKKDSVYSDLNRIRTLRQINSLNVFKYPSITIDEDSTRTQLTANIYLTPKPKYSFRVNLDATHSSIQQVGLSFSPALQARNVFRGGENLSLSGRFNIGSSNEESIQDNRFFNLYEWGTDLNLDIPRILFPFLNTKKWIPNYMIPKTLASIGVSSQKNIGLDKRTLNTVLGYNWTPNDFKKHSIELLNVQFVNNLNTSRFFNVYQNSYNQLNAIATSNNVIDLVDPSYFNADGDLTTPDEAVNETIGTDSFISDVVDGVIPVSNDGLTEENLDDVRSIAERQQRLTENNLIFATNYTFNINNRQGPTDNQFYQFRFRAESAGNLLSAISYLIPFEQNIENDNLEVLDVAYSQYIKTEFDYVKYWDLSRANVLAFHSFFGIAIPYGNSDNIPFVRSYFAGGSNDNRGWRPYSLGPGRSSAINDFNEANLKLALNLEYRFPIAGNVKGALFVDAGNIWNVFDNVDDPDLTFNGLSSLQDIALGSGFGIRYDFTYFVLRGDIGFKTYNPALEASKRWFNDANFDPVLQIGINYPF